ncbi:HEPN domain-containing protein [Nocardioides sp. CCNWLW239]|uniref:HEPN domain-containing protein n=1 Tax=Nocardioides sp. CCNWLW239 TaxID=3128902 RepID=UPI0030175F24
MSSSKAVVELKFAPDEYLCTWHIQALDGTTLHLPGSIEVRPDRSPRGVIHGEVPLESLNGAITLPQYRRYKVLKLTLANGGNGVVLDAHIDWMPGQGFVIGAAAILAQGYGLFMREESVEAAGHDDVQLYGAAQAQVGALDALMGVAPIGEKTDPRKAFADGKLTWTSVTNPEARLTWGDEEGNSFTAWYPSKINAADYYNVNIRFAPLIEISFEDHLSLQDIIDRWIDPIRGIASIATGRSQPVHTLRLRQPKEEGIGPTTWAQVFGTELTQEPYESSADRVRREGSVILCGADGISLLDLVRAWWRLEAEQHPVIDTYAGMLHVKDSHPRSRFLLLIQSLEGMHGHETRDAYEKQKTDHLDKREKLIAAVDEHLSGRQKRFLKKALSKEPARSLSDALKAAFDRLPPEFTQTRETLEKSALVSNVVAECNSKVEPLDALRIARNGLAHGTRGYDPDELHEVNEILDRVVRAHALRLLGCPPGVLSRLAAASGR